MVRAERDLWRPCSPNPVLKVAWLNPTQLRGIGVKYVTYTIHGGSFCIKTHPEYWPVKRQMQEAGGGYHYTEIRQWKGLPHTQSPAHASRQNMATLCNQTQKPGRTIRSRHFSIATVCQETCV